MVIVPVTVLLPVTATPPALTVAPPFVTVIPLPTSTPAVVTRLAAPMAFTAVIELLLAFNVPLSGVWPSAATLPVRAVAMSFSTVIISVALAVWPLTNGDGGVAREKLPAPFLGIIVPPCSADTKTPAASEAPPPSLA